MNYFNLTSSATFRAQMLRYAPLVLERANNAPDTSLALGDWSEGARCKTPKVYARIAETMGPTPSVVIVGDALMGIAFWQDKKGLSDAWNAWLDSTVEQPTDELCCVNYPTDEGDCWFMCILSSGGNGLIRLCRSRSAWPVKLGDAGVRCVAILISDSPVSIDTKNKDYLLAAPRPNGPGYEFDVTPAPPHIALCALLRAVEIRLLSSINLVMHHQLQAMHFAHGIARFLVNTAVIAERGPRTFKVLAARGISHMDESYRNEKNAEQSAAATVAAPAAASASASVPRNTASTRCRSANDVTSIEARRFANHRSKSVVPKARENNKT